MSKQLADQFIQALERLERERELDGMVSLFSKAADIGNVLSPELFHGKEGAREFWTKYRDTFQGLTSSFRNEIIGDSRIALEWTTSVTSEDGKSGRYDGVSILEIKDGQISRFRAYFDPHALAQELRLGTSA